MADAVCEPRSEELAVTLLPHAGARLHSIEAFGASILRLLNGEPHPLRWLAPGATLRFTVTLAFRRWTPGTDR